MPAELGVLIPSTIPVAEMDARSVDDFIDRLNKAVEPMCDFKLGNFKLGFIDLQAKPQKLLRHGFGPEVYLVYEDEIVTLRIGELELNRIINSLTAVKTDRVVYDDLSGTLEPLVYTRYDKGLKIYSIKIGDTEFAAYNVSPSKEIKTHKILTNIGWK